MWESNNCKEKRDFFFCGASWNVSLRSLGFPVGFPKLHNQFGRRLKKGVLKWSFNNFCNRVCIALLSTLPDNAGFKVAKVYSLILSHPLLALQARAGKLFLASRFKRNMKHRFEGEKHCGNWKLAETSERDKKGSINKSVKKIILSSLPLKSFPD